MAKKIKLPKDFLLDGKLTEKQFQLLSWVYTVGFKNEYESRLVWSPRTYLGRAATPAEASTLSKRVSTLVGHRLLTQAGKEIAITEFGKSMLRVYAVEHPNEQNDALKARLSLYEDTKLTSALVRTIRALGVYHPFIGLSKKESRQIEHKLLELSVLVANRMEQNDAFRELPRGTKELLKIQRILAEISEQ